MKKRLIKNVQLLDGVNFFGEKGFVAIDNQKIIDIGTTCPQINSEVEIIDGNDCWITPTFIDTHSHSDVAILTDKELISKSSSGFGVEIVGNCGLSASPITVNNRENLKKIYKKYQVELSWSNFAEYQELVKKKTDQTNIFSLTGHNTLHASICGYQKQNVSTSELNLIKKSLESELAQGSLGLSLGLLYTPGNFASHEEIIGLMQIVAKADKIVAVHLRNEGDRVLESLSEMLELAKTAKLSKLHISHLKTSGKANFHKIDQLLELIENAPDTHGVSVSFDRYPFCESLTQLSIIGPEKFLKLPDAKIMETLQNSNSESQNFLEYLQNKTMDEFQKIVLVNSSLPQYKNLLGLNLIEISQQLNLDISSMILELIKFDSIHALAAFATMSEANMRKIIAHPLALCGSDEIARPQDFSLGRSHVRNFGTSAKFISELMKAAFSKAEIIAKLSYNAAKRFELNNFGELKVGYSSKLNLIDFAKIKNNATFKTPHILPDGIRHV